MEKMKWEFAPSMGRLLLLIFLSLFFTLNSMAQTRTGVVHDPAGKPLAGVSVQVIGTQRGTNTDNTGRFRIDAPDDGVLVFSSVGFLQMQVPLSGKRELDVVLTGEARNLNEVIVVALGMKRESKRLGYSATTVNTQSMNINRTTNFANALEGKVAGVNVSPPAGGPGGSSKIRIRGQSSFGPNNSPLIVVNGIPINNAGISGSGNQPNGTGNPTGGSSDQGDGLQSINMDDVESMTVLKGAGAAALYGSRAKDGAIIITTKSGRVTNGVGIEINSNFQAEQALDYTKFQYQYGQGENGVRQKTVADAQSSGVYSFGEKFDGAPAPQFDGSTKPYLPNKNRIKDFYRTGSSWTNSIALTGGNEKGNFRVSFANTDANALIPNSDFHKKILNFGMNYKFTPALTMQMNINYSNEYNHNPPQIGIQDLNANTTIYTLANSIDVHWLKNTYMTAAGDEQPLARLTNRNNPYWVALKRLETVRRDRIFGNASLRYQVFDWLYVQGRFGQDYYTRPYTYDRPTGTRSIGAAPAGYNGYYYQDLTTNRERNMDFLVGANKKVGKFGLDLTLGGNQLLQVNDVLSTAVTNFYVRDLYSISNGINKTPNYIYSKNKVNSLYGSLELSYKDILYVTATARNDWFSSLNPKSNHYLYPSVSGSFVFTEAFSQLPGWLSFGKLRASYAQVGSGTDPYSTNLYYSINSNQLNSVGLGGISGNISPNPDLRPLKIKETELGLELRTFNDRVNLDVAVYDKQTHDDILKVDISSAAGFAQTIVNLGQLSNKGVEALLTVVPLKGRGITWESGFNASYNKSKVIELANGQKGFQVGTGEFFGYLWHEVGKPLASLRGFDYKRDAKGNIITSGGLFQQGNLTTFGSAIPTWTGGWTNTVSFSRFRIFAQIDFKAGNKILSNSNLNFLRHGLSQASLVGRQGGVTMTAVNADGSPNATAVPAEQFYSQYRSANIATPFVYNGAFVRWRALSVSYDLSRFFTKSFVKGCTVSAVVNNVLMIKKYIDNLDPEASVSASDFITGIETHTLPTSRSYGMNVNIKL